MEITQKGLDDLTEIVLSQYKRGINPLIIVRENYKLNTHFEYLNSSNEWYMNNISRIGRYTITPLSTDEQQLFDSFVCLLETNTSKEPIGVRVFYKGLTSEA